MKPARKPGSALTRCLALGGALILFTSSGLADVPKGAARQLQLAQMKARPATNTARPAADTCAGCACNVGQASGELVVTTGSQIPTKSKRRLQITDSAQNVKALDRKQLERTGSPNVGEAVRRLIP